MNKSFDSSRLVEEIFETEMNQVQAQLSPNSDEPRLQLANIEADQNCDGGGAASRHDAMMMGKRTGR